MGSPQFPAAPSHAEATPVDAIHSAVERVTAQKDHWPKVGIYDRIALLEQLADGIQEVAAEWALTANRAKGIAPESPAAGEEWLSGPWTTAHNIRALKEALLKNGQPAPAKMEQRHGRSIATVYPLNIMEKLLYPGLTAEVWIEPGRQATQGAIYRSEQTEGKVCAVLGAGNISSIPCMDVLYKLFVENEVCVLKMNPVNDYVGPYIERAFDPLIRAGYMAVVYGGKEAGIAVTTHDDVDTLHLTGSNATHDAIVWGATEQEQQKNKAAKTPINTRTFTSELGAVTPMMVVPGQWSDSELTYQAKSIAGMISHNASFDCNAIKCLVLSRNWPQRTAFLNALRDALKAAPPRKAFYPGAHDRYQRFLDTYPQSEVLGTDGEEIVPWTFIPDVDAEEGEYALSNEAFCGVLAEVSLDASGPDDFLQQAVAFANDKCFGTLSCALLVDPKTEKSHKAALDQAVADLRYGGVAVNTWPGIIFGLGTTTWGAYPGHPLDDVQSGVGVVHNAMLFDHPEKSVVYGKFIANPKPVWFTDHRTLKNMAIKLTRAERNPTFLAMPGIAAQAMRG